MVRCTRLDNMKFKHAVKLGIKHKINRSGAR